MLPSLIEGLPGVILEAMYCNTPVVAYDVGGISEVVKNKETGLPAEGHFSPKVGLLVRAGDEEGFVKAVQEVLALPKEALQQLTENAHQLVVREYDNTVIAQRFIDVYHTVTSNLPLTVIAPAPIMASGRNREGMS
jgi:L-malate glycosyltransferase